LNSRPPPPRKLPVPRESPAPVIGSCKASCNDASVLPVQVPKRILNPHSTTTAAETSVAAINTLSREATLIVTLHFPAPGIGLVDSLKHRQSAANIRAKVGRRLWFVGHRSEPPGALPGLKQKAPPNGALASVMPEQRDQQDDRQRHAQQPQQGASGEIHDLSSFLEDGVLTPGGSGGSLPLTGQMTNVDHAMRDDDRRPAMFCI